MRSKLSDAALSRGILLKALDYRVPLDQQGQLDAILHKIRLPGVCPPPQPALVWLFVHLGLSAAAYAACMRGAEWEKELSTYQDLHPGTIVVDAPQAIRNVGSRSSMLAALGGNGIVLQVSDTLMLLAGLSLPSAEA